MTMPTPGPWNFRFYATSDEDLALAKQYAHLIAAAPDLLDALQTILANTEQGAIRHRDYDHLAKDIADCAAAAIAKAKGE